MSLTVQVIKVELTWYWSRGSIHPLLIPKAMRSMFSPVAVPAVMAAFWLSKYELKVIVVSIERHLESEGKENPLRELRTVVATITLSEESKFTTFY